MNYPLSTVFIVVHKFGYDILAFSLNKYTGIFSLENVLNHSTPYSLENSKINKNTVKGTEPKTDSYQSEIAFETSFDV